MPEEFFNSKYQQSRVKKEQQMQKEKEIIDKKKKEKGEKLSRLSELEKQRKEKEEVKKEREKIREAERAKKQEEMDFVNRKKKEKQEKIKQEQEAAKQLKDDYLKRKAEKQKKIDDLNQKAKKERKLLKKEQEEILRQELEKRAEILRSQNSGTNEELKNREVKKALASERASILKKIKFEQKLNSKDQNRIRKEIKEEEQQKLDEARKIANAQAKLSIGNSDKKSLNLDFADDERLKKIESQKNKKQRIIIFIYSSVGFVFVVFMLVQTKVIDLNKKQNINNVNNVVTEEQSKLTDIPNISNTTNFDSVLNYNYKYRFSRFADFFKYGIDNNNSYGYISNKEKELYGATIGRTDDSDGDGYLDGEEIMNLYDPAKKDPGVSLDLKLTDSGKITFFGFSSSIIKLNLDFYYPTKFIDPVAMNVDSIIIYPEKDSKEYISLDVLENYNKLSFDDFLNSQEPSSVNFYKIANFSDTISNNFYINDLGNNAYLDVGNGEILKVSYVFEDKNITNYLATYLMILRSINISSK